MSIRTEIDRITIAKNAIKSAIERKNVPMRNGASIDEYASYIDLIDNNPQTGITIKYWTASDFGGA